MPRQKKSKAAPVERRGAHIRKTAKDVTAFVAPCGGTALQWYEIPAGSSIKGVVFTLEKRVRFHLEGTPDVFYTTQNVYETLADFVRETCMRKADMLKVKERLAYNRNQRREALRGGQALPSPTVPLTMGELADALSLPRMRLYNAVRDCSVVFAEDVAKVLGCSAEVLV